MNEIMDIAGPAPTQIQRVERARRVVSHCSQATIRAYDEEALLAESCRHLVDVGGYCMAWFAEQKVGVSKPISLTNAATESSGVRGDQRPWTMGLGPRMPTMRAIVEQRPQVVRNIPGSPILQQRYPEAQSMGYASVCAFPLLFGPHGIGALTVYAREPDAFGPEEVALLRELGGDIAVGVSLLRAREASDVLEEQLELAERRFRGIVEHAPVGIAHVDPEGRVIMANQAIATLFGYASPEALCAATPDALGEHFQPGIIDELRRALDSGAPVPPFEMEVKRLDGQPTWVEVHVRPANGGSEEAIEAFVRDCSATRAAERARAAQAQQAIEVVRLQELDRLRSDFIGRASHEINTPLTPILLQVQALLGGPDLDERQARSLALIERNVLRLVDLVKDLLQASTLEARKVPLHPVRFDVGAVAAEVVESMRTQATAADVQFRLAPGKAIVFADRNAIAQVLFNLLGNAIKFTPPGGSVTVACIAQEDETVKCTVTDTGVGFAPEDSPKLFAPFARLHEGVVGAPGGTGLGLFISKAILDQSHGRMWGTSEGHDKGATFAFSLPTHAPEPPGRGIRSVAGFKGNGMADEVAAPAATPAAPTESMRAVARASTHDDVRRRRT